MKLALTTALVLAAAAPAFASDQLALSLGVEPGTATVQELALLKSSIDSADENTVFAFDGVKAKIAGDVVSTQSVGGNSQLAASLGVTGGTVGELAALKGAIESADENNGFAVDAIRARINGDVVSTQNVITPGHEQFAASLGVSAQDYTIFELIELKSRIDEAND